MFRIEMIIFPCILFAILIILTVLFTAYEFNPWAFQHASAMDTTYASSADLIEFEKYLQTINATTNTLGHSNHSIILLVDKNRSTVSRLPLSIVEPEDSCKGSFKCTLTFSSGWNDNNSLMVSTENDTRNHWSTIVGPEFEVNTNDRYELLSHLKLNELVRASNILFEGFNETSGSWQEILKCPYDIDGPIEWRQFRCSITVEPHLTKIRPILNAGWSYSKNKEAITWFDDINVTKFRSYIADPRLKFEVVYDGLKSPTNMAFLGHNDFLVLEKDGSVQHIVNGIKSTKPLINLDVAKYEDGGLLGIAINRVDGSKQDSSAKTTYVYLYFTEKIKQKQKDVEQTGSAANRLYRYEFENNTLKNAKLLLDLPAGYHHDGGTILIGPDNESLYLSVGDVENQYYKVVPNKALNNKTGDEPDGSGGILRLTLDGKPINGGILGNNYPLNLYYAYGIRNSFGMGFDPLTEKLWATDNSHETGDEIDLLEPGSNGGWNKVQGVWPFRGDFVPNASYVMYNPPDLVTFEGKGQYHSPDFVWNRTVGPTGLIFMTTDKLGKQYKNDMFVAGVENGRIYHFKLNQSRTGLLLDGPLKDKIADNDTELKNIIFAGNFGMITDLDIGPDGYLYFITYNEGRVYRIVPN